MTPSRAEFIAVGSELLEPGRVETNGSYVALRLNEIGVPLAFRTVVGDDLDDLQGAFRGALARADLVIATGGLGPTIDDLTREAVASLLGLPLIEDEEVARGIAERFQRHGLRMSPQNRRQAMVPRGARVIPNRLGTAPGLQIESEGRVLVLLPGVPHEMRPMLDDEVIPRLPRAGARFHHRVLKFAGLAESEVDRRLDAVARGAGHVAWTILAGAGQVEIHLRERVAAGAPPRGIERLDREIAAILGADLFARDDASLESVVGEALAARSHSVATAESLTGGAIAARLTSIAGASRYLRGGVICYDDAAKIALAGVLPATLAAHGAVSAEVARDMAAGVRAALGADWGVAATGYAGPGAPAGTAAGTVFVACDGPGGARHRALLLPGDREAVRARTSQAALDLLRRTLLETP